MTTPQGYNSGNVWGSVIEMKDCVTPTNHKPYVVMSVDCGGPMGNVIAFGRMFNPGQVEGLKKLMETTPRPTVRLRGFFSQYWEQAKSATLYNFTFYKWEPCAEPMFKAAFILRGVVTEFQPAGEKIKIHLKVTRSGKEGYRDQEEEFDIYSADPELVNQLETGEWEFKGYLQQGAGEDEFGDASGPVLPFVKQARRIS